MYIYIYIYIHAAKLDSPSGQDRGPAATHDGCSGANDNDK